MTKADLIDLKNYTSVSYVRLFRDADGTVIHAEEAPSIDDLELEVRMLRARIDRLKRERRYSED